MKTDKEMYDNIQNKVKLKVKQNHRNKKMIISFSIVCVVAIASLAIILPSLNLFANYMEDTKLFDKGTVNFSTELKDALLNCSEDELVSITISFSNIDLIENPNYSTMKKVAEIQAEHLKQFDATFIKFNNNYESITINISAKNLLLLTCPNDIAYFISLDSETDSATNTIK